MRLLDVDTRRPSGLKYKLICSFKLSADMVIHKLSDAAPDWVAQCVRAGVQASNPGPGENFFSLN